MLPRLLATVCLGLALPGTGPAGSDPVARMAADLRAGRYEDVVHAAGRRASTQAAVLAARAERSLGQLEKARGRLQAAVARAPDDLSLRAELMRVLDEIGDRPALRALVDRSRRDWEAGRVRRTNARELVAIAVALRFDDDWDDANASLRAAVKIAPRDPEANIEWAQTFLAKHAAKNAEPSFRAVLRFDPSNPDAHAGLARVMIDEHYDERGAEAEIAAALAVNPRHASALGLRGELALDAEEMESTAAAVTELRRTNPVDATAAWLAAARALLLDDRAGYEREKRARLEVRAADGDFFASVAEALVRHLRYEDARTVAAEGVRLDPTNARCLASLGLTLLRLGEEQEGMAVVRRARERDPYDERTFNLIDLFDKVIPQRYTTLETSHLSFRIAPRTVPAIRAMVGPYLEEVYARYVKRYGFTPSGRILFELYESPDEYAIRTVGLPRLGATAVCFGRVITSQSPTNAAFNWGQVLSHELAHAFALQLSRARVPRWFIEGLAELETATLRPEWRRHEELALATALMNDSLPSLADLSRALLRARDGEEAGQAYAHAAAAVEFLDRRFGFAKLRRALVDFGRGAPVQTVLETLSGISLVKLETEFRADLALRLSPLTKQFLPAPSGPHDDQVERAAQGLVALRRGDVMAARAALREATPRSKERATPLVTFLAAELAAKEGDSRGAVAMLKALLDAGHDGYTVRLRLGLAAMRTDGAAAEDHLRRAIAFAPAEPEARLALIELLQRSHRNDERLAQQETLLRLEPQNASLAKDLVLEQARRGNARAVIDLAPLALFVDPADGDIHAALGRALTAEKRPREAREALEHAGLFSGAADGAELNGASTAPAPARPTRWPRTPPQPAGHPSPPTPR